MFSFELSIPHTNPTREETILLYGLGEDLLVSNKHVEDFTRLDNETIRVDISCNGDTRDALLRLMYALNKSKNYMARICGIVAV